MARKALANKGAAILTEETSFQRKRVNSSSTISYVNNQRKNLPMNYDWYCSANTLFEIDTDNAVSDRNLVLLSWFKNF